MRFGSVDEEAEAFGVSVPLAVFEHESTVDEAESLAESPETLLGGGVGYRFLPDFRLSLMGAFSHGTPEDMQRLQGLSLEH